MSNNNASDYAGSEHHDTTKQLPLEGQVYRAHITKVFLDVSKSTGSFYYRFYFALDDYEVATNPKDPNGYWFHMHAFNLTEKKVDDKLDEIVAMGKDAVAQGDINSAEGLRNKYQAYSAAKNIWFSEEYQSKLDKWKKYITMLVVKTYHLDGRRHEEQHFYTFNEAMTILQKQRRCNVVFKFNEGYDYPMAEISYPVEQVFQSYIREEVQW